MVSLQLTHLPTVVQTRLTDFWRAPDDEENQHLEQGVQLDILQISKKVNILQLNVCSLTEVKATLLYQLAAQHEVTVLCVSEIGHRREIPGFRCIIASDTHTQSAIFVHHDVLNCRSVPIPSLQHKEGRISSQCIQINDLFILHCYIPPQASVPQRREFWDSINEFSLFYHRDKIILCGDLNTKSPLFCTEHTDGHGYMEAIIDRLPWTIMNDGRPTRLNHALDVCLANPSASAITSSWQPLDEDISDHLPCLIETEHLTPVREQNTRLVQNCFVLDTEASLRKFEHWMKHPADRERPIHMTLDFFWLGLRNSLEYTLLSLEVKDFWTEQLQKLKLRRNKAWRRRKCSPGNLATYKGLDNTFKRLFYKTKLKHTIKTILDEAKDSKNFPCFHFAKKLVPLLRGKRRTTTWQVNTEEGLIEANQIGQRFCEISSDPELSPSAEEEATLANLLTELQLKATHRPVSNMELLRAANTARVKASKDSWGVSNKLVRWVCNSPILSGPLLAGVNHAIRTGEFPMDWKVAKIRALPKPNSTDYRPISLLCNLGKIVEKIVEKRVRESTGRLLSPIQHGCRPMHSTHLALARFTHQFSLAAAQEQHFGTIAFDFSKAYDRVPRHLLIHKLNKMKISPELILFINNWLSDRKFRVHHRKAISQLYELKNGIPQGSALSVLLWLIFINDLGEELDRNSSNLFVDDTLIWSTAPNRTLLYRALQAKAQIVQDWARRNLVKINWNKTQFTHSGYHHSDPPIRVGNHSIYPEGTLRYLGVTFYHNEQAQSLYFDLTHISSELRRRSALVYRLHRFRFAPKVIRQFMDAWVYSSLRYYTPLLGAETHHTPTLARLNKAYNVCLRVELEAFPSTPIPLLYAGTRRLPLVDLIERDSSLLIIRAISGNTQLGKEYLDWDGEYDGWSPFGCTIPMFDKIKLYDVDIQRRSTMSISVRNGLAKCKYIIPKNIRQALKQRLPTNNDIELWTDGSFNVKSHIGASSAVIRNRDDQIEEEAESYANVSSSYEAELLAVLLGLRKIMERNPKDFIIRIFTDSRSLVTHLQSAGLRYKAEESDFCQIAILLTRLSIKNKIFIHWIPGHSGIELNEQADRLANSALHALTPSEHVPRHSFYRTAVHHICRKRGIPSLRAQLQNSHWPNYPPRGGFRDGTNKFCRGVPFRILTGHTRTNQHLFHLGILDSPLCNFCLQENQTPDHLLFRCEQFQAHTSVLQRWSTSIKAKHAYQLIQASPQRLERLVIPALRAGAWI